MVSRWIPLALTDVGLLAAVFLAACRHLTGKYSTAAEFNISSTHEQVHYGHLAARYNIECTQILRTVISKNDAFCDATIAGCLMLGYDEVWELRQELFPSTRPRLIDIKLGQSNVEMSVNHLSGAMKMVALNGGPQTLGMEGFIHHMLVRLQRKLAVPVWINTD
jgi:hypothetical protein